MTPTVGTWTPPKPAVCVGYKTRQLPYPIWKWSNDDPGVGYTHDQIWVANDPGDPAKGTRPSRTLYHYSRERTRRTVKGIDGSLRKARNIVSAKTPVKCNRYVKMGKTSKQVNLELASRHRELAGIKAYVTSRLEEDPMVIIGYHRRLFQIEQSF